MKHKRKVWCAVRKVTLGEGDSLLCYGGTRLQDGLWKPLKKMIPDEMSTADPNSLDRITKWAYLWVWRYRRGDVLTLFSELGLAVRCARVAGEVW